MLIRYRWELGLFAGISLAYWIVQSLALSLFSAFSDAPSSSFTTGRFTTHRPTLGLASMGAVVLLGVSYPYVRRLGRDLLPLVWGYSIAAAAIAAAVNIGLAFPAPPVLGPIGSNEWSLALFLVPTLARLPVLLWLARQASRFSLLHAFFLVSIANVGLFRLLSSSHGLSVLPFPFNVVAILTLTLLLVWLLGNFESSGPVFRWGAVAALLALASAAHAWPLVELVLIPLVRWGLVPLTLLTRHPLLFFTGPAVFVITPALVYLVRVRRPAVEAEA